jgi:hypothetical protein
MKHDRDKAPAAISQAWEGAQDNADAAQRLLDMMQADPDLYREVVAPFERDAASLAVQRQKIAQRSYIWTRPTGPDNRVAALARTNAVSLLDMRLPSGVRLGDATAAEVAEAAQWYRDAETQMRGKAVFFEAIASRVKGRKRVGECLSAAELEHIKNAG